MAKGYSARKGFSGGAGMMQQQAQMQQKLLKMQQEMAKAQEEVESRQFTASVGGGAVTAAVTGKNSATFSSDGLRIYAVHTTYIHKPLLYVSMCGWSDCGAISLMDGGFSCASAGISLMDGGVLK